MALTPYQRIFGAGPRGTVISLLTLALAWWLDGYLDLPPIHGSTVFGIAAFVFGSTTAAAIVIWSLRSLPPDARGRELVTRGPFRYVRHPLYAGFLGPFDLGLAFLLDSQAVLVWAILQYPIWHWNIRAEERLMLREFGDKYAAYCKKTSRFIPKLTAF